ncbi:DUF2568 domain-containing protein [Kitasatospora acidiphila]|uniref:DUF2568 domain-containing protein n=1 Tax=Kitasatospora acidiphila TaxID=2567942 RepID=A0A540W5A7_9ACTN|nr:YrdB family protein [Kitasatospora acidiphila]TQF04190.1 DUF2568 domain-containing protein [Kitasatospora acidiphila]
MGSRGLRGAWYANEGLAFLLELAALAWLAWWGWTIGPGPAGRLLLGLGSPVLAAVLWGRYASPRAAVRLPLPGVLAVKAVVFLAASAALGTVVGWLPGLGFALLCAANVAFAEAGRLGPGSGPGGPGPTEGQPGPSR